MKRIATRIWLLIVTFIVLTVLFMYFLTQFLYLQLYVADAERSMEEIGVKLQTMYKGGRVEDQLIDDIEIYNSHSNYNVFAVRNPRELSACVPFDIDYDALIGVEQREQLLANENVSTIGYEPRFERQVISVMVPLVDQNRLEGIIYLYFPLAKISELTNKEILALLSSAFGFSLVMAYLVSKGLRHIMRPLRDLQKAVDQMAGGNYDIHVPVTSIDEIGKLSQTFNDMAVSIHKEDEARKNFLATVSHELRTPISYVKGYSEAMQNGLIKDEDKEETVRLIVRETNRMERLTNELLQLARMENEATEKVNCYPIPLAETLREVEYLIQPALAKKNISLHLQVEEDSIVMADEEKLKQIFINLIENAINYSEAGQAIHLTMLTTATHVTVQIKDFGQGIPAEDLPHITERFYRVNKARSRIDGGSGLGLSIVEQLVKQLNATMRFESELGIGTIVFVDIPLMEEL
ncbi:two-component sensor histidine kinase [Lysinibacillus alkalisoli]|uniref:histidine kinase n=1 Tax=Lysinibacillus alkalisoli TaxID=1911548 RepID=A0A917G539_9BACI|nr:sensor histidine kinase [Lysinibacillus alkalisoli]GGG23288.1 two-component sensor histidine kinase [Lysinibacillus alkalisoli]